MDRQIRTQVPLVALGDHYFQIGITVSSKIDYKKLGFYKTKPNYHTDIIDYIQDLAMSQQDLILINLEVQEIKIITNQSFSHQDNRKYRLKKQLQAI